MDRVQLHRLDVAANPSLAACDRLTHSPILFGLGALYGWGYCPFTDWHWEVRARLGHHDPPSYVQLLIHELTGIDVGPVWADTLGVTTLAAAALLSVGLNARDRRARPGPSLGLGPGPGTKS